MDTDIQGKTTFWSKEIDKKEFTTIRVPPLVTAEGRGYLEDRRPPSSLDPYAASAGLVRACIFGDFLRPGNDSLKDLSVWDKDPSELKWLLYNDYFLLALFC